MVTVPIKVPDAGLGVKSNPCGGTSGKYSFGVTFNSNIFIPGLSNIKTSTVVISTLTKFPPDAS